MDTLLFILHWGRFVLEHESVITPEAIDNAYNRWNRAAYSLDSSL